MTIATGFDAYRDYLALVRHFSTDYDYEKFNGKVRVRRSTYDKRHDRFWFDRIARHHDPHWLMVCNLVEDPHAWVGTIARGEDAYARHKGRLDSLEYATRRDMEVVTGRRELVAETGRHPMLARRVLGGEVSMESLVVVGSVTRCVHEWAGSKDLVLRELGRRAMKYSTFVTVSPGAKKTVIERFAVDIES